MYVCHINGLPWPPSTKTPVMLASIYHTYMDPSWDWSCPWFDMDHPTGCVTCRSSVQPWMNLFLSLFDPQKEHDVHLISTSEHRWFFCRNMSVFLDLNHVQSMISTWWFSQAMKWVMTPVITGLLPSPVHINIKHPVVWSQSVPNMWKFPLNHGFWRGCLV